MFEHLLNLKCQLFQVIGHNAVSVNNKLRLRSSPCHTYQKTLLIILEWKGKSQGKGVYFEFHSRQGWILKWSIRQEVEELKCKVVCSIRYKSGLFLHCNVLIKQCGKDVAAGDVCVGWLSWTFCCGFPLLACWCVPQIYHPTGYNASTTSITLLLLGCLLAEAIANIPGSLWRTEHSHLLAAPIHTTLELGNIILNSNMWAGASSSPSKCFCAIWGI